MTRTILADAAPAYDLARQILRDPMAPGAHIGLAADILAQSPDWTDTLLASEARNGFWSSPASEHGDNFNRRHVPKLFSVADVLAEARAERDRERLKTIAAYREDFATFDRPAYPRLADARAPKEGGGTALIVVGIALALLMIGIGAAPAFTAELLGVM